MWVAAMGPIVDADEFGCFNGTGNLSWRFEWG